MNLRPVLLSALFWVSTSLAADHAVILAYHHVSEDTPALTSVTPDTFAEHLQYLQQGGFQVWPVGKILDRLEAGQTLPVNTVALSFDDAYRSVYDEAFPRMRRQNWPLTLFVNTDAIDRGYKNYMSWEQIRELVAAGAEVGNHSQNHAHLVRRADGESEAQWRQRIIADIKHAEQRLIDETGIKPSLFAYPYGEYSDEVKQIVSSLGYRGVAQHSGAVGSVSDLLAVPRFPMSSGYANMNRFATSVHSRPLPVLSAVSAPPTAPTDRIDHLQLFLGQADYRPGQLACYSSSGQSLPTEIQSQQPLHIQIDLAHEQSAGRNKINCTAASASESGFFFSYSYQWLVKKPDGSWYRE